MNRLQGNCLLLFKFARFLKFKGLILTFFVYQVVSFKKWDSKWVFNTAAMIAGYLCLNLGLFIKQDNQYQHFLNPLKILSWQIKSPSDEANLFLLSIASSLLSVGVIRMLSPDIKATIVMTSSL